jgi:hypothetical protein
MNKLITFSLVEGSQLFLWKQKEEERIQKVEGNKGPHLVNLI